MFQRVFFALFLILVTPAFAAEDTKPSAIVEKIPDAWEEKHKDKPFVNLLTEYKVTLNDDWSYEEVFHYRIRVQKDSAKYLGEQEISYNKAREEILDLAAHVETPDGKKHDHTNIQDLALYEESPMYSDLRVKVVTLPQVVVGSIIDVTVRSKTKSKAMPNQYWDEIPYPYTPTKRATYTYIFPADKPIVYKHWNNDHKPVVERNEKTVKYTLTFQNTDGVKDEDYMPPYDQVFGVSVFSSVKDWDTIADWYRNLIAKNTVEDPDIKLKVEELIAARTTPKEKALAILEFLQDNFRYVSMSFGDHTVEPHPSTEIFKNRYGDCKDWSILAKQMLKLAGIESNICLFSSEYDGNPQNSLPNISAFDHVILEIDLEGEKYFYEPQARGYDIGQLPPGYDHAHVLVIEEKGSRFDHLPVATGEERAIAGQNDVYIDPNGGAIYEMKVELPIEASQSFREVWRSTTDENKERFYDNLEATFARGGEMIERDFKGLDKRYGPIEIYLKYRSPNAYPLINDMIVLKEDTPSRMPEFNVKERKYPIFVPMNSHIHNVNVYHIPPELRVDYLPEDYKMSVDFIDIVQNYDKSDGLVTVESILRLRRSILPADQYPKVLELRNEHFKRSAQYIVLKRKEAR